MVQAPRELVATVSINRLEETKDNPQIHGKDMKVACDGTPNDWRTDSSQSQDHYLNGRRILSGKTKRRRILMVDFMDVLV